MNEYVLSVYKQLRSAPHNAEANIEYADMWRRIGSPIDALHAIQGARKRGLLEDQASRLEVVRKNWFMGPEEAYRSRIFKKASPSEQLLLWAELNLPHTQLSDLAGEEFEEIWHGPARSKAITLTVRNLQDSPSSRVSLSAFVESVITNTTLADYVGWIFLGGRYTQGLEALVSSLREAHPTYFGTPYLECALALKNGDLSRAEELAIETMELQSYHAGAARTVFRLRRKRCDFRGSLEISRKILSRVLTKEIRPDGE